MVGASPGDRHYQGNERDRDCPMADKGDGDSTAVFAATPPFLLSLGFPREFNADPDWALFPRGSGHTETENMVDIGGGHTDDGVLLEQLPLPAVFMPKMKKQSDAVYNKEVDIDALTRTRLTSTTTRHNPAFGFECKGPQRLFCATRVLLTGEGALACLRLRQLGHWFA